MSASTNLPTQMRHVAADGVGGAEILRIVTGPLPVPAADEVLIRVAAAGVNRPDLSQREGRYPVPPEASPIMGLEVAGEVVGRGAAADRFALGAQVCGLANGGGYAEYCVVPQTQCLPWPKGVDAITAAALPETYFTVWANLFQIGGLAKGQSALVHGGSSGIGTTAIQLGNAFGARIFATAGSDEKCDACERLGAVAINYRTKDFVAEIARLTDKHGVDVVLDMIAGDYTPRNLRCLAPRGRLVIIGLQGGRAAEIDLSAILYRRLTITGSTMRPRDSADKGRIAAELQAQVWPLLDAGRCLPIIHQTFPLEAVGDAHRMMESSQHIGKLVLTLG